MKKESKTGHRRFRKQMKEALLECGPLTSADLGLELQDRHAKSSPTQREAANILAKFSEFEKVGRIRVFGISDDTSYWVPIWGVVKERDALDEIREEYYAMLRGQMYEDQ